MKRLTLVLLSLIMGFGLSFSQTKVSGVILSADDGEPIFGATVVVKGKTSLGTTSDLDGKFSLNVQPNSTLMISYLGFETQEAMAKTDMRILLKESTKALQEVMVTAVGIKRAEKSLAYGAAQVKGDAITQAADRSALNALQGKVAGLSIGQSSGAAGASTRVFIRGFSSLTGNNQPLFVIDGVPVSNGGSISTDLESNNDFGNRMNDINPNDIESMSVLKGASASALYGSRAANGVIMITTKKGVAADRIKIDFANNTTFSNVAFLPKFQDRYGQGWSAHFDNTENGSWGPQLDGKIRPWGYVLDNSQLIKPFSAQKENMKDFYDTGVTVDNSLAISGGKDRTTFYFSYSNIYDNGVIPTKVDTYNRNAISLKGSYDGRWLIANANINYIKKATSVASSGQGYSVFNNLLQVPRDFSIVDMKDYQNKFYSVDNWYTPYGVINPYYSISEDGNKYGEDRVYGSVDLTAVLPVNIKLNWRGGGDVSNGRTKTWRSKIIPQGTNIDGTKELGSVFQGSDQSMELNSDLFVTWEGRLSKDMTLNLLAGQNVNLRQTKDLTAKISVLDLDDFYELTNTSNPPTVVNKFNERRLVGLYAQADLAFKDYLFLNLGVRNDWSSTLPKDNNSFMYPTMGVSFLFSDAFPSIRPIIPYGKLRASFGMTGNDASAYQIYSSLAQANQTIPFDDNGLRFPFGGVNGFTYENRIGNPNLKAELSKEWEIGADVRFLKNRIGVEVSYYNKQTVNQIMPVDVAPSSGFTTQLMNLGSVRNQGIELLVNLVPIRTKDWIWDLSVNFTRNRSKVESLGNDLSEFSIQGFASGQALVALPGYPLGMFVGYAGQKDAHGNPVVDKDGMPIQSKQREIFGTSEAKFQTGLSSSLTWKNITLGIALDAKVGGLMFSRTRGTLGFVGNSWETLYNDRQSFIVPNSVTVDGQENTMPILQSAVASYWNNNAGQYDRGDLIDKSYIKLRDLYISYSLPKTWIKRTPFNNLSLSLVGKNLLTWTPKNNRFVDPTVSTFGTDLESEFGEFSTAPSIRSLGFSIKLSL